MKLSNNSKQRNGYAISLFENPKEVGGASRLTPILWATVYTQVISYIVSF
jgi:hypothetical protein